MEINKHVVVYVTRSKLWVGNFGQENSKLYELEWNGYDPTDEFEYIKKTFKTNNLRVVLGYEYSYVVCFEVLSDTLEKEHVLMASRTVIPEDISAHNYFWKVVDSDSEKKRSTIQLIAVIPNILNNLSYAAKKNKLTLEFITSIETVLGDITKTAAQPKLIVWGDLEKIALVSFMGNIYVSEEITYRMDKRIGDLVAFAKDTYGFKVNHAILDWHGEHLRSTHPTMLEIDKEPKFSSQWKIEIINIDPMLKVAQPEFMIQDDSLRIIPIENPIEPKSDDVNILQNELPHSLNSESTEKAAEIDKEILVESSSDDIVMEVPHHNEPSAMTIDSTLKESEMTEEKTKSHIVFKVSKKILLGIICFFVTLVLIGGAVFLYTRNIEKVTPAASPLPSPSVSPTPSPITDISKLSVQVLNGTSQVGLAGRIKALLEDKGFVSIETGNARNKKFEKTEVLIKDTLSQEKIEEISEVLSKYEVDILSATSGATFDVSITLGSVTK